MRFRVAILFLFLSTICKAQIPAATDTLGEPKQKFNAKQLIVPGVLVTYGIISLESKTLNNIDNDIRDQAHERYYGRFRLDDFSQLAPAAAVYALNLAGIKGKHNFSDRTVVIATAMSLSMATTTAIKSAANVVRPDLSTPDSFPSGHTTTAFTGAEFMWQEYKDVNVLVGISGYVVATATGFMRVYNKRHWFSDIVMGAGIGILSTKAAYLLLPIMKKGSAKKKKHTTSMATPFYDGRHGGIGAVIIFD